MEENKAAEIVPDERIQCLVPFYLTGLISDAALIVEEIRATEFLTEESKNNWALMQWEATLASLHVYLFVMPLDKGGEQMPSIAEKEKYIKVFLAVKTALIIELEKTFPMRRRHRDRMLKNAESNLAELDAWEQHVVKEPKSQDPEAIAEYEAELQERDDGIITLTQSYDLEFSKWRTADSELRVDEQKVEDWNTAARLRATKQHREDSDALLRAKNAMGTAKKYLQGLMVKVPSIVSTVMKMDVDGVDPYRIGDLRKVYCAMLEQFRKSDELGIATCLMSGMRLQQTANQPLKVFVRKVEEFHQTLLQLGVTVITIADLVAMVAIGGMLEKHRSAFMETETVLALAKDSLEGEDEGSLTGDSDSSTSKRIQKRTLFAKVLAFVKSGENKDMVNNSFGRGAQGGVKDIQGAADKQKLAEQKEARAVLNVIEKEKKKNLMLCFDFFTPGNQCQYGDKCRFLHALPKNPNPTPPPTVVNSAKSVSHKGEAVKTLFGLRTGAQLSGFGHDSSDEEEM